MPKEPPPEEVSAKRVEAAEAAVAKADERLSKLRAELAKAEAVHSAATAELEAATARMKVCWWPSRKEAPCEALASALRCSLTCSQHRRGGLAARPVLG